jgi:aryl-alcohol dehydrogenase-like predicted oxidoreductase
MERDPTFQKITPDKLLEFVLSNPDIAVSIVGSRYPNRVQSNIDNVLELEYLEPDEITKYMCEAAKLYDFL